jgi:hypothetical protein
VYVIEHEAMLISDAPSSRETWNFINLRATIGSKVPGYFYKIIRVGAEITVPLINFCIQW